jgi:hypothetical protein
MTTSNRRVLGAAVLGTSLAIALVAYFSGTPLLSLGQWHTTSFPGGSTASASIEIHWPFVAVCFSGLLGLLALVWPQRNPPRPEL